MGAGSIPWFNGRPETYQAAVLKGQRQMNLAAGAGGLAGALLGQYKHQNEESHALDDQLTQLQQAAGVQLGEQVLDADEQTDVPGTRDGETQGKEREDVPPTGEQGQGPQSSHAAYVKSGALGSREFGQGPAKPPNKLLEALRFAGGPFVGTETQAMRQKKLQRASLQGLLDRDKIDKGWVAATSNDRTYAPDRAQALKEMSRSGRFDTLSKGVLGGYQPKGGAGHLSEIDRYIEANGGDIRKGLAEYEAAMRGRRAAGAAAGQGPNRAIELAEYFKGEAVKGLLREHPEAHGDPNRLPPRMVQDRTGELLRHVPPDDAAMIKQILGIGQGGGGKPLDPKAMDHATDDGQPLVNHSE